MLHDSGRVDLIGINFRYYYTIPEDHEEFQENRGYVNIWVDSVPENFSMNDVNRIVRKYFYDEYSFEGLKFHVYHLYDKKQSKLENWMKES